MVSKGKNKKRGRQVFPFFDKVRNLQLVAAATSTAFSVALARPTARTGVAELAELGKLLRGENVPSFEFHLDCLVSHLILKLSQLLLFLQNSIGAGFGITPERTEFLPLCPNLLPQFCCFIMEFLT